MLVCLWWGSRKFGEAAHLEPALLVKMGRIILASLMMGATVWSVTALISPILQMPGYRVLALVIILIVGIGSYIIAGRVTGAFTVSELRKKLRN
jgi:putative peptidoglycan lipid II flippase